MFKSRFLTILSKKSHFEAFCGRRNESKSNWKQKIHGICYLNSSITRIALKCFTMSKNTWWRTTPVATIREAIFLCEPLNFYEYVLGVGCGPQVGPFLSRPTMGSIRGEGTPPTNPSRHLKKERSVLPLKWLLKEDQGRRPTAASVAATAAAQPRAAAVPAAETAASPCLGCVSPSRTLPAAAAATAASGRRRRKLCHYPPRTLFFLPPPLLPFPFLGYPSPLLLPYLSVSPASSPSESRLVLPNPDQTFPRFFPQSPNTQILYISPPHHRSCSGSHPA